MTYSSWLITYPIKLLLNNLRNHLALLVNIKLNGHVVGFHIGGHEAIITVPWIFFLTSIIVVQIEFVIKMF